VFGENGYPHHENGVVPAAPGLFFLGLRFQYRMSSSLIGGVGRDAAMVAARIAARCDAALDRANSTAVPV